MSSVNPVGPDTGPRETGFPAEDSSPCVPVVHEGRDGGEASGGGLTLFIHDRNQFWFILPDGVLLPEGEEERHLSGMRAKVSRRAVLLARTVFLNHPVVIANGDPGKRRVLLEFQPCLLVGRTKGGAGTVRIDPLLSLDQEAVETTIRHRHFQPSTDPPSAEPSQAESAPSVPPSGDRRRAQV